MDTDITVVGAKLYFIPVQTRVPLKFGPETLTSVICARVCMTVAGKDSQTAAGWGETPLSVQWVWPSASGYNERCEALKDFCKVLCREWAEFDAAGHAIEVGSDFINDKLGGLLDDFNAKRSGEAMPRLAALVCCSAFDIALHDAFGQLLQKDIYSTYTRQFMNRDLAAFIAPADDADICFEGKYPADFLEPHPAKTMPAWHLVGGKDLLDESELTGDEPDDGYPVLLADWIRRDGLTCLKVKLRGNDAAWDYDRLVKVGTIAIDNGAGWLTSDFNCTVTDPAYVNDILDRLLTEHPRLWRMILYVEQPFPYDLETHRIDVHSVSARKPLFMDESAHDWKMIRLGRSL